MQRPDIQEKNWPLVSIVSVNWNQAGLTRIMLQSLKECSYPALDIWVVDNGSSKGNLKELKSDFPETNFVISPENLGFAGGNNLALSRARGKYVLLLNNDTEVDRDFLQPMVELMEKDENIGIVSPKIFFYDDPETLQYAGTTLIHPITNRGKKFGYGEKDTGKYDHIVETGFPNGACMLVRGKLFEELGLLYENYFLYYEEHDFAHKVRVAGNKIFFQPKSKIYHKVSASTGKASPLKTYYLHRNRQLFNRRNFKGSTFLLSSLYYFLVATPKALLTHLLSMDTKRASAIWRATFWHGKNLSTPKEQPSSLVKPEIILSR
ncbi:MAG: glycosyltransferase family 2 protein [Bacteroidia bacterium]|nr:glycosyltransferase family 2 protein [Bacteroidia bacterium]